ncbi:MAG: outer membrane lipoprotein-sorting protein [Puniceicoccales bacterium]|nr:outer membrane lipoprotein-sorting protein [Puniceicoccales bacterium]
MKLLSALFSISCLCASITALQAAPTPAEVIRQARVKIGTEATLSAVRSLSLEGNAFDADGKKIGLVLNDYKLPNKRREYSFRTDRNAEITLASNGLEGFLKSRDLNTQQTPVRLLNGTELKASTDILHAELDFFATPKGGKITYAGEGTQQGKVCNILEYQYAGGIIIRRYFEKTTALLVAQEIYDATTPKEDRRLVVFEGVLESEGIRFPKKIINYAKGKIDSSIEYTAVKVNPTIPDSVFAFPMP